jgi:hypothetical protein
MILSIPMFANLTSIHITDTWRSSLLHTPKLGSRRWGFASLGPIVMHSHSHQKNNHKTSTTLQTREAAQVISDLAPSNDNRTRLKEAIDGLCVAIEEQKIATRKFSSDARDLKTAVEALTDTCKSYLSAASRLSVDRLNRKVRRLARIMGDGI